MIEAIIHYVHFLMLSLIINYGHNVGSVQVDDTLEVWPGRMNGGVKHESGHVDAKIGRSGLHGRALHVHLNKA